MNIAAETKVEAVLEATVIRTQGRNKCPKCGSHGEPVRIHGWQTFRIMVTGKQLADYRCMKCETPFTIRVVIERVRELARTN